MYSCQTHFDFTNLVSEVHRFKVVAISLHKKWSWTPCTNLQQRKNFTCQFHKRILFYNVNYYCCPVHTLSISNLDTLRPTLLIIENEKRTFMTK